MKEKIMNLVKRIGLDKIGHNIAFLYFFITLLIFFNAHLSLLFTAIAAAAVELVYDKWWGKGTPETLDWVASMIGAAYLYIVILLFL